MYQEELGDRITKMRSNHIGEDLEFRDSCSSEAVGKCGTHVYMCLGYKVG